LLIRSFLTHKGNNIGDEGASKLSEALKSHPSLASLDLSGNGFVNVFNSFSLDTDNNNLEAEGAAHLSEALKSNTSLTTLSLWGNRFVSFHSHSIRGQYWERRSDQII
jgi:hypothetical protein